MARILIIKIGDESSFQFVEDFWQVGSRQDTDFETGFDVYAEKAVCAELERIVRKRQE
jgi:hypothetical protein